MQSILVSAGFTRIEVASNGRDGLSWLESEPDGYDIILVDLSMPELDGISFLKVLKQKSIAIPAVVLSAVEDIEDIAIAMFHGAFGYIPKSHKRDQLLMAIASVLQGDIYLPTGIREQIERVDVERIEADRAESPLLTRRQREVLMLLKDGMSNREMADSLFFESFNS